MAERKAVETVETREKETAVNLEDLSFLQRVILAQNEVNAPKNIFNKYGDFWYRSVDDIMQGAKPICDKFDLFLQVQDQIIIIGDRFYVKATAKFIDARKDADDVVEAYGYAREPQTQPKMNESQVTGSASTFARKYALNALLLLDDSKDDIDSKDTTNSGAKANNAKQQPTTQAQKQPTKQPASQNKQTTSQTGTNTKAVPKCADCGNNINGVGRYSAEYIANGTLKAYGKQLCQGCGMKQKNKE